MTVFRYTLHVIHSVIYIFSLSLSLSHSVGGEQEQDVYDEFVRPIKALNADFAAHKRLIHDKKGKLLPEKVRFTKESWKWALCYILALLVGTLLIRI